MSSAPSSLSDKVLPFSVDGAIIAAAFLGAVPALVTGGGKIVLEGAAPVTVEAHGGAILAAAGDGTRLVTGGDDGRVMETVADGTSRILAEHKGRWIDRVAVGPDGAVAYSAGKTAYVLSGKGAATGGEPKSFEAPSTVGGLAFAPKGLRLAVAHYGGVSLWFPNAAGAKPELLGWKGSHLGVAFSPDGRFVVTTMQEPALHGWRVVDGAHMRMSGYPSRVKSFAFTADGKWLASSGSGEAILWPFQSKDGPMGKQPTMLAPSPTSRVTVVAPHPKDPVVAVGYEDGMVMMARISDGAEILLRAPTNAAGGDGVSAIAWHPAGGAVVFGTATGKAGRLVF
ncbi:WD40 repeat domain-containing protein [Xanthobacter agilis]|uniref:WD40 repeat protein n=1 Tax=Xanthobacter agilis TaxID=47492 RepID=A0ABU0LDJ6_XANAG|nr:WD40 repeat domain-containing protein [Xanthobacter agilis]MDQ0505172.1 WD40 repeat protein [Xanthobacter agilis]